MRGDAAPPSAPIAPPGSSGPLLVTPANSTLVATDALHTHLEQLDGFARQLAAAGRGLRLVESRANWSGAPGAPRAAQHSAHDIADAITAARSAQHAAERAVAALRRAIERYDDAERAAGSTSDLLAAMTGAELGAALRVLAPSVLLLAAAGWLASKVPDPGGARKSATKQFFLDHPELITGEGFVRVVRSFSSGLDEGMSTFAGIPAPIAVALGVAGATGVRTSSRTLLNVGPLIGLFRETPVTVDRVSSMTLSGRDAASAPAVGAVGRLSRVPEVNQVRVEKYDAPGQASRFVVYVGPTETFSPRADHEPWDLTSNVGGVGGLDVGAFRATELAMKDAGVSPESPVQFVGFSEGGLVATMLAGSGDWNAAGIQTFAAPAGNIALPEGLNGMAIRHTDDFIPMLAGPQLDHHLLQVERQAFAPGAALPIYEAAPAHQRDTYLATATAVDAATSSAVRRQNAALDAFTHDYSSRQGAAVTVTMYHGERQPDGATPALKEVTSQPRANGAER